MDMQKINHLYSVSNRFSSTRLALNYYILMERYFDGEFKNPSCSTIDAAIGEISEILKGFVLNDNGMDEKDKYLAMTERLRDDLISKMEALTIYVDHFENFEYVLNRLEYRFSGNDIVLPYTDERLTAYLLEYIFRDRDNAAVNMRTQAVLGQLPLRMTKQKFFSLLLDGLSVYREASPKGIDSILFFIRGASGITRPSAKWQEFNELYQILAKMEQVDYKNIDGEIFKQLSAALYEAIEKVTFFSDIYLLLQEIVNDLYVILLTCEYSHEDYMELKVKKGLIELVMHHDFGEKTDKLLVSLEGRQESLYEKYLSLEPLIESLNKEDEKYQDIMKISRLLSSSSFMSLSEEDEREETKEGYLDLAAKQLVAELEVRFETIPMVLRRSIMAKILSSLPVFFQSYEQMEEYFRNCLSSCSDVYEKYASMILLKELMETDDLV